MLRFGLFVLGLLAVTATGFVLIGFVLMMPAHEQTAAELERARFAVAWAPSVTLALGIAGAGLTVFIWRRSSHVAARLLSGLLLVVLAGSVWLSSNTPAETVFAPIESAGYSSVDAAEFLEPEDMVLGVHIGGAAKAYPVGQLVYHHLVNDVVGGAAVVATF